MIDALDAFDRDGFTSGRFIGGDRQADGSITWPSFMPSDKVRRFMILAHEDGWVGRRFDWSEWKEGEQARNLRDNPGAMARANIDDIEKLITVIVRQERFSDGSIKSAIDSGLLKRVHDKLILFSELS